MTRRHTKEMHPMDPIVVRSEDGEPAGVGPIRCRIIEDGSHTAHRLALVEAIVPPGPAVPPEHIHGSHDEVFIVTRGRLRFSVGGDTVDAPTDACVVVPAGTPHTFSNPFDEPATFITTLTPDLYVQYFRDLGSLPVDDRGMPNPADIARLMARYDTHVVAPVRP